MSFKRKQPNAQSFFTGSSKKERLINEDSTKVSQSCLSKPQLHLKGLTLVPFDA